MDLDLTDRLQIARRVVLLVGAGISTSSGIPDFRSDNGVYSFIQHHTSPWLSFISEPQQVFDMQTFLEEPRAVYTLLRSLYSSFGKAAPSLTHSFLAHATTLSGVQRIFTQNVDGLEMAAGANPERLAQCHGDLRAARCTECGHTVTVADDLPVQTAIADDGNSVPFCHNPSGPCASLPERPLLPPHIALACGGGDDDDDDTRRPGKRKRGAKAGSSSKQRYKGVYKPCAVFFHEPLPASFESCYRQVLDECDCLIVIGSSLKVQPVASFPLLVKPGTLRILINNETLPHVDKAAADAAHKGHGSAASGRGSSGPGRPQASTNNGATHTTAGAGVQEQTRAFDYELIGDADSIVAWLWHALHSAAKPHGHAGSGSASSGDASTSQGDRGWAGLGPLPAVHLVSGGGTNTGSGSSGHAAVDSGPSASATATPALSEYAPSLTQHQHGQSNLQAAGIPGARVEPVPGHTGRYKYIGPLVRLATATVAEPAASTRDEPQPPADGSSGQAGCSGHDETSAPSSSASDGASMPATSPSTCQLPGATSHERLVSFARALEDPLWRPGRVPWQRYEGDCEGNTEGSTAMRQPGTTVPTITRSGRSVKPRAA